MLRRISGYIFVLVTVSAFAASSPANATSALHADIQVDTDCSGSPCGSSTLANSNTTRKLAVSSNGTIYALFRDSNGIWVSRSTTRGASFSSAVNVSTENKEAEIGTSANGSVYVIWNSGGNYVISKSSNGGSTWSSPINIGAATGAQAHMAIDGDYLYAVGQSGTTLYRSSDGGNTWATTSVGTSQVFADVHVDPITHNVYVFTDNPSVYWYVSSDRGVTLSAQKNTGKSVFYSVGALTSTGSSKFFYMAGSGTNLEKINLTDESVETKTVSSSSGSTTRSLAADACGNVVSGHKSGSDLQFQYSTDSGSNFSAAQTVIASADRANASINTTNGDVMFLYEKSGDIFLTTYASLLTGGSNCYAATFSQTAIEFTAPGQTPSITLSNTSNSPLSVDSISMTGTSFIVSHNCGSSIPAGSSCSVTVSGSTQATETLTISLGGVSRSVPVALGSIAASQPPVTTTTTSTTTTSSTTVAPQTTTTVAEMPVNTTQEQPTPTTTIVEEKQKEEELPETGFKYSNLIYLALIFIAYGLTARSVNRSE